MKAKLICADRDAATREIVLMELPVTVGRRVRADVHVEDSWVSRRHCVIDEIEGTLLVRDLGSRNGTFVNGLEITKARVMPGDRLTVGTTTFVVDYELQVTALVNSPEDLTKCEGPRRLAKSKVGPTCAHGTLVNVDKNGGDTRRRLRTQYGNPERRGVEADSLSIRQ